MRKKSDRLQETLRKLQDLQYVDGLKPMPVDSSGSIFPEGVPATQDTRCEGYRACLAVSAYDNWARFTCMYCPVYMEKFSANTK